MVPRGARKSPRFGQVKASVRWRIALSGMLGVAYAAGLAWPIEIGFPRGDSLWWLQTAAMLGFVFVIERTGTVRQAGHIGLAFHSAALASSLHWLYIAMATYGGLPGWLAALAVLALALALAVYGAGAAMLYVQLRHRWLPLRAGLFAATWLLAELARGQWLTGFGWSAAGYAHTQGPLAGWAPWVGVYGIGFLCALWAAVVVLAIVLRRWRPALVVSIALTIPGWLGWSGGEGFTQASASLQVALLQGNIPQNEKFESTTGVVTALSWYGEQLRTVHADLVLAPETAIPVLPQQIPDGYWDGVKSAFGESPTVQLVGIPLGSYSEGYTNSVIALTGMPDRIEYRYDKHHLVPFGEFIPPLFKWFVRLMDMPLGDFSRGDLSQASAKVGGTRVSPSICFEDLFAEELAVRFRAPSEAPEIFANFSNLAWFGESTAMHQHLHISQMRSLEFERPFLRVSNTGVTAVVDHNGQVRAALEPLRRGVLRAEVQGRTGMTPFAHWSARWGQWPLWLFGISIVATACCTGTHKRKNSVITSQT